MFLELNILVLGKNIVSEKIFYFILRKQLLSDSLHIITI